MYKGPKKESKTVGGAWSKTSKAGTKYLSVRVELGKLKHTGEGVANLSLHKNGYKESEKHPDYVIYEQEPFDKGGARQASKPAPKQAAATPAKQDDDELPF